MTDRLRDLVYLQVESELLKAERGKSTWWFDSFEVACDETFHAHEHDRTKLRQALLAVATAAVGWIEAIDSGA